jgi:hypothetical protein
MDEHSIKKRRYLNKIFTISAGIPSIMVPLIEIVKAFPMNILDEFFSKITLVGSDMYQVYIDKCSKNNDTFVRYVLEM